MPEIVAARRLEAPAGRSDEVGYGRAGCSLALTTSKSLLTRTSSSLPSLVVMCDSYGASEVLLVSVRTIVAPGYLSLTAASTLSLVSPVSAVSPGPPGPPRPCLPPGPPRPRALSAWTAVASKDEFTSTTWSLPAEVLMCAWYGVLYGPPASVRSTVAPGTLSRAAALTLAAFSLDSVSRCLWASRVCDELVPEDEVPVDGLLAAPAMAEPPRLSAPRARTVAADLRAVLSMNTSPFVGCRAPMLLSACANQPVVG